MNKYIHIALCWEDKNGEYTKFTYTTILSILRNNQNIFLHLICPSINEGNERRLKELFNSYGVEYKFYKEYNPYQIKFIKMIKEKEKSTFGIGTYLRLLIPSFLDRNIDKVLYLDSDIIVDGSLKELYDNEMKTTLEGYNHNNHPKIKHWRLKQYINAGVLKMDLNKLRKVDLYNLINNTFDKYKGDNQFEGVNSAADQDLLNIIFDGDIKLLDEKYNWDVSRRKLKEGIIIYHYLWMYKPFRFKPCFIKRIYKVIYFYYFDMTPWGNWRPNINLKNGIKSTRSYFFLSIILRKTGLWNLISRVRNLKLNKHNIRS